MKDPTAIERFEHDTIETEHGGNSIIDTCRA